VIAQGSDGRHHFPAAVAGEIYRQLNHRFGTAINLQVATTADDEEKEVGDDESGDVSGDSAATTDQTTAAAAPSSAASDSTPTKTPPNQTAAPRNTVKRVLMPIVKKPADGSTTKPAQPVSTTKTPTNNPRAADQRPRRAQPEQP